MNHGCIILSLYWDIIQVRVVHSSVFDKMYETIISTNVQYKYRQIYGV